MCTQVWHSLWHRQTEACCVRFGTKSGQSYEMSVYHFTQDQHWFTFIKQFLVLSDITFYPSLFTIVSCKYKACLFINLNGSNALFFIFTKNRACR